MAHFSYRSFTPELRCVLIALTDEHHEHVFIKSRKLRQLSPERISADGIIIDLPGHIIQCTTGKERRTP